MHADENLQPFYVWDLVVRTTHWAIALSIALLAGTGIYMGHPFLEGHHFVMGGAKVIHFYSAIVFSLAVASRVAWMFLGPRRSGWRNFIPASKRRRHDLVKTVRFYMLLDAQPPRTIGHNPLAGLSYVGIFAVYFLMIATGFALYSVSDYGFMRGWSFLLPLFHGVQWARWIHHVGMWILIAFFVAHMFFSSLTSRSERNGVVDSIFSGWKFLPKGTPPDDE